MLRESFGDLVSGPGGRQILLADPDCNLIEPFQPADRPATTWAGLHTVGFAGYGVMRRQKSSNSSESKNATTRWTAPSA